jgi:hypothetical protein
MIIQINATVNATVCAAMNHSEQKAVHDRLQRPGKERTRKEGKRQRPGATGIQSENKKVRSVSVQQLDGGISAAERLRSPGCGTENALGFVEGQGISV